MKYFKYILVYLFVLTTMSGYAQVFETKSFVKEIQTIRIENPDKKPYYPVIELGSQGKINLSFDDLSPEISSYSYTIIHCNADWTKSSLNESEYLEGLRTGFISDYKTSINTFFSYTHYELTFPNNDIQFKVSGNYVVLIFKDNDTEHPVLSACFSVVSTQVGIKANVTSMTEIDYNKGHQQLEFAVSYPNYNIQIPSTDLKIVVRQNLRTDNQVTDIVPTYFEQNNAIYKNNRKLIFDAGNEFRNFDISSTRILSNRVKSIDYYKPYYHVTLFPDEIRKKKWYTLEKDINGRYIINVQFSDEDDTEGDYFFVHFTLPMETPILDGNFYLLGQFNEFRLDEKSKMVYNFKTAAYENTLLLKQGGYNYNYVFVPNGETIGQMEQIEGNYWETENEYIIYVYHRPFGGRYDELIGVSVNFSNQQ